MTIVGKVGIAFLLIRKLVRDVEICVAAPTYTFGSNQDLEVSNRHPLVAEKTTFSFFPFIELEKFTRVFRSASAATSCVTKLR